MIGFIEDVNLMDCVEEVELNSSPRSQNKSPRSELNSSPRSETLQRLAVLGVKLHEYNGKLRELRRVLPMDYDTEIVPTLRSGLC